MRKFSGTTQKSHFITEKLVSLKAVFTTLTWVARVDNHCIPNCDIIYSRSNFLDDPRCFMPKYKRFSNGEISHFVVMEVM
jgi:hypothetical protein